MHASNLRKFGLFLYRKYSKSKSQKSFNPKKDAYILDAGNIEAIKTNIAQRKGIGNIELIHNLLDDLRNSTNSAKDSVLHRLAAEIDKLPNNTHPTAVSVGDEPKVIEYHGEQRTLPFEPKSFAALCKHLNVLRTDHLGNFCGTKAYYLLNELAELVIVLRSKRTKIAK